jgi:hypothetical protein
MPDIVMVSEEVALQTAHEDELDNQHATDAPSSSIIGDAEFMAEVARLKDLRDFVLKMTKTIEAHDIAAMDFGSLESLRFGQTGGRPPTTEEWRQMEYLKCTLLAMLPLQLRRRYFVESAHEAARLISYYSLFLGSFACIGLIIGATAPLWGRNLPADLNAGGLMFPWYCVWAVALGGVGSIAFIGMNALLIQDDITFDLSNRGMIRLRTALGAIFALTLAVPFGFHGFYDFSNAVWTFDPTVSDPSLRQQKIDMLFKGGAMLILPFVFGFSTSAVILILNRFVAAIQSFFGTVAGEAFASRTAKRTPELLTGTRGGSEEEIIGHRHSQAGSARKRGRS